MSPDQTMDIFQHMLYIVVMTVSLIVTPGLIVGLCVAIFQAATQINEMTLSFLPKLFVILLVTSALTPWLMNLLVNFTEGLFMDIPYFIQ